MSVMLLGPDSSNGLLWLQVASGDQLQAVSGYSVLSNSEGDESAGLRRKRKSAGRDAGRKDVDSGGSRPRRDKGGGRQQTVAFESHNQVVGGPYFEPAAVKKDLVIGMAKALLEEQLAVFSSSLREHMEAGSVDIVIFMDDPVSARMRDIASRFGVTLVVFEEKSFLPVEMRKYHPSTYRWAAQHSTSSDHGSQRGSAHPLDFGDSRGVVCADGR